MRGEVRGTESALKWSVRAPMIMQTVQSTTQYLFVDLEQCDKARIAALPHCRCDSDAGKMQ